MYQYFVKIVPTAYVKIDGQVGVFVLFDSGGFSRECQKLSQSHS